MRNRGHKWHVSILLTLLIGLSIGLAVHVFNNREWEALFNLVLIAVNIYSLLCIIEG